MGDITYLNLTFTDYAHNKLSDEMFIEGSQYTICFSSYYGLFISNTIFWLLKHSMKIYSNYFFLHM